MIKLSEPWRGILKEAMRHGLNLVNDFGVSPQYINGILHGVFISMSNPGIRACKLDCGIVIRYKSRMRTWIRNKKSP